MNDRALTPITFPTTNSKPWVYTSFVSTLDGKVFIKKPGYWPLGSNSDYTYFSWLRAHADIIIDGRGTAETFGAKTIEFIHSEELQTLRQKLGKTDPLEYAILTDHKNDLLKRLHISLQKYKYAPQFYAADITLQQLISQFYHQGKKTIFVDGGPTLLSSLIAENLLDEIYLTLAPKIVGSEQNSTLTMVEGQLFTPEKIAHWRLVSLEADGDEVFIRYQKR